ncbi:twin-arginine translocation signal domain-containing protein [Kitasatospora gansuensis]
MNRRGFLAALGLGGTMMLTTTGEARAATHGRSAPDWSALNARLDGRCCCRRTRGTGWPGSATTC